MQTSSLSTYATVLTPKPTANTQAVRGPSFAAVMAEHSPTNNEVEPEIKTERSDASLAFEEWMSKSEAEKVREAILEKMGLTEEALEAMDPEERARIEEQIAREMVAEMQRKIEEKTYQDPNAALSSQQFMSVDMRNISLNEINSLIKAGYTELLDVVPFIPPHVLEQYQYDPERIGEHRFNLIEQAENIAAYKEHLGEDASFYRLYLDKIQALNKKDLAI